MSIQNVAARPIAEARTIIKNGFKVVIEKTPQRTTYTTYDAVTDKYIRKIEKETKEMKFAPAVEAHDQTLKRILGTVRTTYDAAARTLFNPRGKVSTVKSAPSLGVTRIFNHYGRMLKEIFKEVSEAGQDQEIRITVRNHRNDLKRWAKTVKGRTTILEANGDFQINGTKLNLPAI